MGPLLTTYSSFPYCVFTQEPDQLTEALPWPPCLLPAVSVSLDYTLHNYIIQLHMVHIRDHVLHLHLGNSLECFSLQVACALNVLFLNFVWRQQRKRSYYFIDLLIYKFIMQISSCKACLVNKLYICTFKIYIL